jgi:hypothetical protein
MFADESNTIICQIFTTMLKKIIPYFLLISFLSIQSCQPETTIVDDFPYKQIKPTSQYKSSLPKEWMEMAYTTVKNKGFFALDASRLYAYTSITMYESMVYGIEKGKSLEGQLREFNQVPKPDPSKTYDWGMVLCHATPKVLIHLLSGPSQEMLTAISGLERTQERQIIADASLSQEVVENSKQFASALAAYMITYSDNDGRARVLAMPYTMPSTAVNPANYDGVGEANSFFMSPFWWMSRPFVISTPQLCEPLPPYTYSEDPASKYYQDVLEVVDATKDPAKVKIGQYWANNPLQSGTPAGSWVAIASQVVDQHEVDIITTLKMYTLMTMSTRDAFIAVWWTKYQYNIQRPVSYIRRVLKQNNWTSPVPTPPYPDYLSGTSTNAGSSSEILTRLVGAKSFKDSQHADKGFGTKEFASFKRAAFEAYHSRIYAGVHMRKACEEGYKHGECIGNFVMANIDFEQ